jgi:hypothetical protein
MSSLKDAGGSDGRKTYGDSLVMNPSEQLLQEHELFLKGLELFGRKWTKIQAMVPNKTVTQVLIKTRAQNVTLITLCRCARMRMGISQSS